MSHAQRWWTLAADGRPSSSAGGKHDSRDWQERSEGRNANELAAEALGRHAAGRELTLTERRLGARAIHYTFGTVVGGVYGSRRGSRSLSLGEGLAFGLAVWAIADELAMPILGLSQSTRMRPIEMHLQAAAAHVVYGGVTEITRAVSWRATLQDSGAVMRP
jgi:hypothetical protein